MTGTAVLPAPAVEDGVPSLLLRLGQRLSAEQRDDEARRVLQWALREGEDPSLHALAHRALSALHLRHGELRSACDELVAALVTDPGHGDALVDELTTLLRTSTAEGGGTEPRDGAGSRSTAHQLLDRRIDLGRLDGVVGARACLLIATAALTLGLVDDAVEAVRQAADRCAPVAADGVERLVQVFQEVGFEGSDVELTRAQMLAAAGREEDAGTLLEQLVNRADDALPDPARARAYEEQGRLLERSGRSDASDTAWSNAGIHWLRAEEPRSAMQALDHVRPSDVQLPFLRADALRMTAYTPESAGRFVELLREAQAVWQRADDGRPVPGWALESMGLLTQELAYHDEDRALGLWRAALYFERAVSGDSSRYSALANCADMYATLGLESVAVWCCREVWNRAPEDPVVLATTSKTFANAELRPPPGLLERLGEQATSRPWERAVTGVLARNDGDLAGADSALASALSSQPDLFWAYDLHFGVLVRLGRWEDAENLLRGLLRAEEAAERPDWDRPLLRATAFLFLEEPRLILDDLADDLMQVAEPAQGRSELLLAGAAARRGDADAFTTWLDRADARFRTAPVSVLRDAADLLTLLHLDMARAGDPPTVGDDVLAAAERLGAEALRRSEQTADAGHALAECLAVAEGPGPAAAVLAASAMSARMLSALGRDDEAIALLERLRHDRADEELPFPEALDALTEALCTAARRAAGRHRPDEVVGYLAHSRDVSAEAGFDDPSRPAREVAAAETGGRLDDPAALVALSQGLGALARMPNVGLPERVQIAAARRELHRENFGQAFAGLLHGSRLEESPVLAPPVQPVVVLQADSTLFADQEQTPAVQWLLQKGIPAMKDRLDNDRAPLPGVRIRSADDLSDLAYQLLVRGTEVGSGTVRPPSGISPNEGAPAERSPDERAPAERSPDAGSPDAGPPDAGEGGFAAVLEHLERQLRPRRWSLVLREALVGLLEAVSDGPLPRPSLEGAVAVVRQLLRIGCAPPDPRVLAARVTATDYAADLVEDVAALAEPVDRSAGLVLDAGLEDRIVAGLGMYGGRTTVVLSDDATAELCHDLITWWTAPPRAQETAVDGTVPERDRDEQPFVLVRDPRVLLAVSELFRQAGRSVPVAPLATPGGVRHG